MLEFWIIVLGVLLWIVLWKAVEKDMEDWRRWQRVNSLLTGGNV